jgi:hypothetical protein
MISVHIVTRACLTLGNRSKMSTVSDAARNKFIVMAQRDAKMTIDEAGDMAEFVVSLGASVLETLLPVLTTYKSRVAEIAREEVVKEIVADFSVNNGIVWTRNSVLARIKAHSKQNGSNSSSR